MCDYGCQDIGQYKIGNKLCCKETFYQCSGYKDKMRFNVGKTKETSQSVAKQAKSLSETMLKSGGPQKGKPISLSARKKISETMKSRYQNGEINFNFSTGNRKPSFAETFFKEVIKNEILDKSYICEYRQGRYLIDFAWKDKKKCIEIDGEQHFQFQYRIESDKRKDEYLQKLGWKILRIRWTEMYKDTKYWINIAKNFIDN